MAHLYRNYLRLGGTLLRVPKSKALELGFRFLTGNGHRAVRETEQPSYAVCAAEKERACADSKVQLCPFWTELCVKMSKKA